mmetsp:Transcript_37042/g.89321  ORF Transcript_37042/g.89321 Transcript_37042/m.89321 type:complete len:216 (+) Transcript_37042:2019-2666(+)
MNLRSTSVTLSDDSFSGRLISDDSNAGIEGLAKDGRARLLTRRGVLRTEFQAEMSSFLPNLGIFFNELRGFEGMYGSDDDGFASSTTFLENVHCPSHDKDLSFRAAHHFEVDRNSWSEMPQLLVVATSRLLFGVCLSIELMLSSDISSSSDLNSENKDVVAVSLLDGESTQSNPTSTKGMRQLLNLWQRGHLNSLFLPPSNRSNLSSRWEETDFK